MSLTSLHPLAEENKEQSNFFIPETETAAPDYWRESTGNTFIGVITLKKEKKKDSTVTAREL